jgi:hypothetical protein
VQVYACVCMYMHMHERGTVIKVLYLSLRDKNK